MNHSVNYCNLSASVECQTGTTVPYNSKIVTSGLPLPPYLSCSLTLPACYMDAITIYVRFIRPSTSHLIELRDACEEVILSETTICNFLLCVGAQQQQQQQQQEEQH